MAESSATQLQSVSESAPILHSHLTVDVNDSNANFGEVSPPSCGFRTNFGNGGITNPEGRKFKVRPSVRAKSEHAGSSTITLRESQSGALDDFQQPRVRMSMSGTSEGGGGPPHSFSSRYRIQRTSISGKNVSLANQDLPSPLVQYQSNANSESAKRFKMLQALDAALRDVAKTMQEVGDADNAAMALKVRVDVNVQDRVWM